jgi:hypothetical protein
MPSPSHASRFYHPHNIGWAVQIIQLLVIQSPPLPRYLVPPRSKCSQTPSASFPPAMSATKFHTHTKQQARL